MRSLPDQISSPSFQCDERIIIYTTAATESVKCVSVCSMCAFLWRAFLSLSFARIIINSTQLTHSHSHSHSQSRSHSHIYYVLLCFSFSFFVFLKHSDLLNSGMMFLPCFGSRGGQKENARIGLLVGNHVYLQKQQQYR